MAFTFALGTRLGGGGDGDGGGGLEQRALYLMMPLHGRMLFQFAVLMVVACMACDSVK